MRPPEMPVINPTAVTIEEPILNAEVAELCKDMSAEELKDVLQNKDKIEAIYNSNNLL